MDVSYTQNGGYFVIFTPLCYTPGTNICQLNLINKNYNILIASENEY